jgi:putative addiction module component (TIGR02574 family)
MSPKIENVVKQALELPNQDRAFIAEKLLESLDYEEPFEVSREWKKEINKRCRQIDQDDAQLIAGDKVFKEAIKNTISNFY